MNHAKMDHENMDHAKMMHGQTDREKMKPADMDHSKMDHSKMGHGNMDMESSDAQSTQVSATGKVLKIDSAARTLRIKHNPIPAISWPVMTMIFEAGDGVDLSKVSQGADVEFEFDPDGEDGYVISAIRLSGRESDHNTHGNH